MQKRDEMLSTKDQQRRVKIRREGAGGNYAIQSDIGPRH